METNNDPATRPNRMASELLCREPMATVPATQAASDSWDFGRLGPYRVIGSIAIGGMGVVLRAQDLRDGRMVAVKTTRSKRASEVAGIRREISLLGQNSHPAIVRLSPTEAAADCRGWRWSC